MPTLQNMENFVAIEASGLQFFVQPHINGLVQERRNSIANALELRTSCTNPST